MANLKNITELPVVESAEGLKLIVNDDGRAKQIAASAVGMQADWNVTDESSPAFINNKPHRELMYEWNFEADENPDNCVWQFMENVDEDVSWLTTVSEDTGWEIEVSQYGYSIRWDDDTEMDMWMVNPDVYTTTFANNKGYYTRIQNDTAMSAWTLGARPEDYMNDWSTEYLPQVAIMSVYDKVFHDDNWNMTEVDNGGLIVAFVDDGGPLKSIKIYKVYR